MKKIIVLLIFTFSFWGFAQEDVIVEVAEEVTISEKMFELNWVSNFKDASKLSKKEGKPIFILFSGSDWCEPCKRLEDKVLNTKGFDKYANSFILYKADFPRNKDLVSAENKKFNKKLQKKYNQESFPTIVVINSKGELIDKRAGVYMYDSYFPFFEGVVNREKM